MGGVKSVGGRDLLKKFCLLEYLIFYISFLTPYVSGMCRFKTGFNGLKEDKNPIDVRSYKPVDLTNILWKNIWKDNKQEIGSVPWKRKKITGKQFSFKKQRRTIDVISKINYKITWRLLPHWVNLRQNQQKENIWTTTEHENTGLNDGVHQRTD